MRFLLTLALLLALTVPYMPRSHATTIVEAPGKPGAFLWRYSLPLVPVRLAHPALPKLPPLPYDAEAEALVLAAPEGYGHIRSGPMQLSEWLRQLGAVEGYRVCCWGEGVLLYSIATVFWDDMGAYWYMRGLAQRAEAEGLQAAACPLLDAESIISQRDMGNGTGSIVTFRWGNLTGGVTVTANGDGLALACEFARRALAQMRAVTQQ